MGLFGGRKTANTSARRVANKFVELAHAYLLLPEASRNNVARRIPRYVVQDLDLRKHRFLRENNHRRNQPRKGLIKQRNTGWTGSNASGSARSSLNNNRSSRSRNTSSNRSRATLAAANLSNTRYALRSTNNRRVN